MRGGGGRAQGRQLLCAILVPPLAPVPSEPDEDAGTHGSQAGGAGAGPVAAQQDSDDDMCMSSPLSAASPATPGSAARAPVGQGQHCPPEPLRPVGLGHACGACVRAVLPGGAAAQLRLDLRPCAPLQRAAMAVLHAVLGGEGQQEEEAHAALLRALYAHPGEKWAARACRCAQLHVHAARAHVRARAP